MKNIGLIILAITIGINLTAEAKIRQEIIPIVSGDSVALILTVPPLSTESFHVYRQGPLPANKDYVLLTAGSPVRPENDANKVKSTVGEEWTLLSDVFGTNEPFDILRKLRGDDFIGMVHSLISPKVAILTGRWYLDTPVEKGADYNYRVVIVTSSGDEKTILERKVNIHDVLPKPPTDLKADFSDSKVTLTWDYPQWAGSYDDLAMRFAVYRKKGTDDFIRLDTKPIIRNDVGSAKYVDLWLSNGVEYTYYIAAVDPLGRQSQPSAEVKVTPKDIDKPLLPQNLAIESGDGVILLSWNMSLELDVEGYNIYRSLGLEKTFSRINTELIPADLPVFYDSTITNGVQYFYCVTAVDAAGNESNRSNTISAVGEDKTPPDTPRNLRFAIRDRVLTLTWSPVKARDLAGYYVYRGMSEEIQPKIIHEPYLDTIYIDKGYQDVGMTAGKDFWVSVSAVDHSRNESDKLSLIIEIPDDVPPLPPQGFKAENIDGRYVKISCTGSSSLDVAKYRVMRAGKDGQAITVAEPSTAPFALNDSAVTKGETMVYYAIAIDTAGNSSAPGRLDTLNIKDNTPPPSPRNCTAKLTEAGVSLKWERVIDFDLVGYNVYRSTIPSGVYEKVNAEPLKTLEFIDRNGNVKYYYKVKAIDTSGNESTRSEAVNAG